MADLSGIAFPAARERGGGRHQLCASLNKSMKCEIKFDLDDNSKFDRHADGLCPFLSLNISQRKTKVP